MIEQVVAATMHRRGTRGWLVGGTVRDRLAGRFSPDLDIVVDDDPRAVAAAVARALEAPWFPLSARHGAYRVMAGQGHVDVAPVQGATIQEDLARRDFTVNAMAAPLGGSELVDPFDGWKHLRAGLLFGVSDRIFGDDPLRLMRAARFAHVFGMRLHPSLDRLVREQAVLLERAAGERVTTEVVLTLGAGRSLAAVKLWDELGLLSVLLPEVMPLRGEEALPALDALLLDPKAFAPQPATAVLEARLAVAVDGVFSRPVALRLALLLRGLAPARALAVSRRFKLSAAMQSLLQRCSSCFTSGACSESNLRSAAGPGRPTVSFLWTAQPWEPEVLLLAAASLLASSGRPPTLEPVRSLLVSWARRSGEGVPPAPVDGHYLMERLRLEPGPDLGRLLREVRLAWESGEARTAEELVETARRASGRGRVARRPKRLPN